MLLGTFILKRKEILTNLQIIVAYLWRRKLKRRAKKALEKAKLLNLKQKKKTTAYYGGHNLKAKGPAKN